MTVKAKEILNGKFWIVEDEGEKIGTLSLDEDKYIFTDSNGAKIFNNKKQLKSSFGELQWTKINQENKADVDKSVHGYPTNVTPYNAMYDVKRKLPLFTKSQKSTSLYCAGYYIIRFDKGWVKSFCPKLITVERYNTKGPFKSEFEMKQELSRANK